MPYQPMAASSLFNPRAVAHLYGQRRFKSQLAIQHASRTAVSVTVSFSSADRWCRSTKKEVTFHREQGLAVGVNWTTYCDLRQKSSYVACSQESQVERMLCPETVPRNRDLYDSEGVHAPPWRIVKLFTIAGEVSPAIPCQTKDS